LALALGSGPRAALGFCLTRGCNESDPAQPCEYDEHGCLLPSSGELLHWDSSCVSFDIQQDGSVRRGLDYELAQQAIRAGFEEWLSADCGHDQGPDMQVMDYGPVECGSAEYNQEAGNANVFMFRDDDWPYKNAIDTLALTTLIFNAKDGAIYDADVEINTFESDMALGDIGPRVIDFQSVITHEIGHFLGLSHSDVAGATMLPSYRPGNRAMASIERDDVEGVCAALPPGRKTPSDSCDPRHGFSAECALGTSACHTAPGRPGSRGVGLAGLAGLSWTLLRRKLRRKARPRAASPGPRRCPG
jgi:hypothetical protein